MEKFASYFFLICTAWALLGCAHIQEQQAAPIEEEEPAVDEEPKEEPPIQGSDITITKNYEFEKYLLEDSYPYGNTTRHIKWSVIKDHLAVIENSLKHWESWAVIQNYKNKNGEAPLTQTWQRNEYKLVADSLGISRYQSVPLYLPEDTITPRRYGRDGTPSRLLGQVGSFSRLTLMDSNEEWLVPNRYVLELPDSLAFTHAVFIDVADQNIVLLKRTALAEWTALSTNPATTGRHKPPYAQETPLGFFMIQEKKRKMFYHRDGTTVIAGYAPYASRFTNGAYIHGVPTQNPKAKEIEYSASLGTTPRSHMCVRNASSHARFIYENAPTKQTFVVVIK